MAAKNLYHLLITQQLQLIDWEAKTVLRFTAFKHCAIKQQATVDYETYVRVSSNAFTTYSFSETLQGCLMTLCNDQ